MFINTYINDLHISEGDSYRGDCPMCRGKNTFTATKMDEYRVGQKEKFLWD